ncbi:hypothetical protein LW858_33250 (plasmid) [Bacillus cereus]|uniref:hypothetical protein n=1 Tax=Bacillus cereus TaxID=1396 RepID=UPI001F3D5247|nr:hypothetical protein [Bacillus cereus]UIJ70172.1 hypothetical protein LW858_33250 [Bacillus cereus]
MKKAICKVGVIGLLGISMISTSLFGNISVAFAQEQETTYATQYEFTMNNLNQYNGLRVKELGNPTIYLIDNGTKRGITSPAAMDKYNFRWDMPIMPAWMEHTIPDGTSIHS